MAWLCRGALGLKDQRLLKDRKWEDKLGKCTLWPLCNTLIKISEHVYHTVLLMIGEVMFLSLICIKHLTKLLIKYTCGYKTPSGNKIAGVRNWKSKEKSTEWAVIMKMMVMRLIFSVTKNFLIVYRRSNEGRKICLRIKTTFK